MKKKFRLQPYESRSIAEKILDGIDKGMTINEISIGLEKISSSTIYKIANKLKECGFIEAI